MKIDFSKYHGAGNDFVMIDGFTYPQLSDKLTKDQVAFLCDRHFGIGADGLIILNKHDKYDFEMVYYNADGKLSSMCGNGGRCILRYAEKLGYISDKADFLAVDGPHEGIVGELISLKMSEVIEIEKIDKQTCFLDTGSPHYVQFRDNITAIDILEEARAIRYNSRFAAEGTNVNFVEKHEDGSLSIRTYERGVEDETLACGTGVVACALAHNHLFGMDRELQEVKAVGGELNVTFSKEGDRYRDIWLVGPAEEVFSGTIYLTETQSPSLNLKS